MAGNDSNPPNNQPLFQAEGAGIAVPAGGADPNQDGFWKHIATLMAEIIRDPYLFLAGAVALIAFVSITAISVSLGDNIEGNHVVMLFVSILAFVLMIVMMHMRASGTIAVMRSKTDEHSVNNFVAAAEEDQRQRLRRANAVQQAQAPGGGQADAGHVDPDQAGEGQEGGAA
ncbi:hypothetical protein [Kordiimonas lacus]|uniref:Uncharacterized protein n=1 Tax=Kordiimonas lacus TaxID=637679 RepID=A0A1G7F3L8_9PROT|nr:hypothetical protein [Kordiimonas lacus]SDE70491.1 hypothetical protein SAMN04488071_3602 [Kordiimonas lacus]